MEASSELRPKTPRSRVICGDSWSFTDLPPSRRTHSFWSFSRRLGLRPPGSAWRAVATMSRSNGGSRMFHVRGEVGLGRDGTSHEDHEPVTIRGGCL